MKKKLILILALLVCTMGIMSIQSFAASTATLEGPGTVRAGDTITLKFYLNGTGVEGAQGSLSFDTSKLTLLETSKKIADPWKVEFNGNDFVCYDDAMSSPFTGKKEIFQAKFKVNAGLGQGTAINVSCVNVKTSDGSVDTNVADCTFSATIAAPLSNDCALSSLGINGVTLSPDFAPDTTSYTAEVPYETSKVTFSATTRNAGAWYTPSSAELSVGKNTVEIKVTAENGAKKTYTIVITRKMNENATDSKLSKLSVDGYENCLSPKFSASVTSYVLWLPNETSEVSITANASDYENAKVTSISGNKSLKAGADNTINVVCTAGNGTTTTYTIIAKRASGESAPVVKEFKGTVTITGETYMGKRLTANILPEDTTATYKCTWFSGETEVGTGLTYNVAEDDVLKDIWVRVEGTDMFSGYIESEKIKIREIIDIVIPTEISGTVSIVGNPTVGKTISAEVKNLTENATVSYQWYVDGAAVGIGATYNVCEDDIGKDIKVKVEGYDKFSGSFESETVKAKTNILPTADPGKQDDSSSNVTKDGSLNTISLVVLLVGIVLFTAGIVLVLLAGKKKQRS